MTLAGPTDGRWQGGFSRFFCVGKLCAATKRSPFLLNFLSHMSHGYLGQTASQASFLCLFYIGAVDIFENRMEHLSSLLRALTYWGSLCSSFFDSISCFFSQLSVSGRQKLPTQSRHAVSVQDSQWMARFGCPELCTAVVHLEEMAATPAFAIANR